MAATLAAASSAVAQQSYDVDPEVRVQQLENQLRQLTGQNEELQYRNRQLDDRLRQLGAAPAGQPAVSQPNVAATPAQPGPAAQEAPAASPGPSAAATANADSGEDAPVPRDNIPD